MIFFKQFCDIVSLRLLWVFIVFWTYWTFYMCLPAHPSFTVTASELSVRQIFQKSETPLFTPLLVHEWRQLSLWLNVSVSQHLEHCRSFIHALFIRLLPPSPQSWHSYKLTLKTPPKYSVCCLFFISACSIKSSPRTVNTVIKTPPHAYTCAACTPFIIQLSTSPEPC